ncbi:response regulator transcription factor [Dysosmobacter sp. NSJ-60]|jgi:DNA-binding response OmpR family regulator|uniref:Stage 0 sporulation protein A homolog n=1 Tax=Pusillibacter faecalis TaxID=2714358 RepID=A0A810Q805_9FIRM|nr:response regulator transcription factor [Pusillibacter faecalis]MBC5747602.1 response regulator transcription factor [Dysosmobacter hominis]MBS5657234.1 response regulator transcription factor [Oscillibacter sp.]MCQ5026626.1 response regulator transcription factor [Oscillibacter valericigenes]BCK84104.1 transcriptional regulatory protein DltR [Pusillibacter faecalis]
MRILIVEDEVRLASSLQDLLELGGYSADISHDGESGLDNALTGIYDVVLLDVMLPKLDGFTVLRRMRAAGNATPVLMLTARSEVADKVEGLDCGADYYLTKPFEPQELLACIRALTRRQPELRGADLLEYGDLKLDKSAFSLSCGERSVRLSRKEYDMMELLMRNRDLILTKETLLLKIWGYESDAEDNNVEVYISFLRKKLEHLHSGVKIKTIRMVGYCLAVP